MIPRLFGEVKKRLKFRHCETCKSKAWHNPQRMKGSSNLWIARLYYAFTRNGDIKGIFSKSCNDANPSTHKRSKKHKFTLNAFKIEINTS